MTHSISRLDPARVARIVARRPLRYLRGEDPTEDRPAHVRAASSIVRFSGQLVAIQDDALFLACIDPHTFSVRDLPLPRGAKGARTFDDARGNKAEKLDLEASVVIRHEEREVLLAFGSGSTPAREQVVWVDRIDESFAVRTFEAPALYRAMRANEAFSGSELNLEGVVLADDDLLFFQRGNGAPRPPLQPIDATARVDARELLDHLERNAPCPQLRTIRTYDLGTIAGARLTFTDATWHRDRLLFVAAAEASPDATRDGPVSGVVLGVLDSGSHSLLRDERGEPSTDKVEGIVSGTNGELYGVVDRDDPDVPALLLEIAL